MLHHGDAAPSRGVLIVSPVSLTGVSESADEYAAFRDRRPDAIIGNVMRVFVLTRDNKCRIE